ncbi:MAG TPA: glutathione transferase GstA, partial [bacterium]|nr:glutathione transferase GstA [bacterium]
YYSPGACSLSPHIVLREAGYDFDLEKVDLKDKKTESGGDFNAVHRKSYVPQLRLDDDQVLSEGAAIVQYLADQKPESGLAPQPGSFERVRLNEWLNFISAEMHKSFGPFFYGLNQETLEFYRKKLARNFKYLSEQLQGKKYLLGDRFTIADAYLFTVLNWTIPLKIDLTEFPVLKEYMARIAARPKVQEAMKAEGLINKEAAA